MTRDELFKLASQSGMLLNRRFVEGNEKFTGDCLERFAAFVAAAEREACAKLCEQKSPVKGGEIFAARIRARGQQI